MGLLELVEVGLIRTAVLWWSFGSVLHRCLWTDSNRRSHATQMSSLLLLLHRRLGPTLLGRLLLVILCGILLLRIMRPRLHGQYSIVDQDVVDLVDVQVDVVVMVLMVMVLVVYVLLALVDVGCVVLWVFPLLLAVMTLGCAGSGMLLALQRLVFLDLWRAVRLSQLLRSVLFGG